MTDWLIFRTFRITNRWPGKHFTLGKQHDSIVAECISKPWCAYTLSYMLAHMLDYGHYWGRVSTLRASWDTWKHIRERRSFFPTAFLVLNCTYIVAEQMSGIYSCIKCPCRERLKHWMSFPRSGESAFDCNLVRWKWKNTKLCHEL